MNNRLKRYPAELKADLIKRAQAGEKVKALAEEHGVEKTTIYKWLAGARGDRGYNRGKRRKPLVPDRTLVFDLPPKTYTKKDRSDVNYEAMAKLLVEVCKCVK